MKTNRLILTLAAAALALTAVSCSDMLDIPQKGVLDYNTYYNTDDQITSAEPVYPVPHELADFTILHSHRFEKSRDRILGQRDLRIHL